MPTGTRAHIRREVRQRVRRDPTYRLSSVRYWEFTSSDNPIDTPNVFDDRTRPLTVALTVVRSASSNGVLFEAGGAVRGLAAWLDSSGNLGWAAGSSTAADGFTITCSNALPTEGQAYKCVFSVLTGTGQGRVWVDGHLVGYGQASSGSFNGLWGAVNDGAIGDIAGTVIGRVPAPSQATLANAEIIGPVEFYDGAFPQTGDWL